MTGSALSDLLTTLAKEDPVFEDGARVLDASDTRAAIFEEIDATVLPATLTFEAGAAKLELVVTNQRVHRIMAGAPDDVLDQPLNPDNTDLTERAARAISDFAEGATTLRVRHAAAPGDSLEMSDRVSTDMLAATLGEGVQHDPNTPLHERFLSEMADTALATIHLADRVAGQTTGSSADIAGLKIVLVTQLSAFLDTRRDTCASYSDPSLTLWRDVQDADQALGIADFGENVVLFSVPMASLSAAHILFRRSC
jgi:hypothetical protein